VSIQYQFSGNADVSLTEHAISWITERVKAYQTALTSLETDSSKPIDECPVEVIRDMSAAGGEKMIGTVSIRRCSSASHANRLLRVHASKAEEGQDLAKINSERDAGDPQIVWTIGCK
jgi:hypothetical protein